MQLRELLPVMHHGRKLDLLHPPFDFQESLLTALGIPNTLYVCVCLLTLEFPANPSSSVNSFKTYSEIQLGFELFLLPYQFGILSVCIKSFRTPANRPSDVPLADTNLLGSKTNDGTGYRRSLNSIACSAVRVTT